MIWSLGLSAAGFDEKTNGMFFAAGDAEMGAGHKEQITTASDVMSGLRLSLSRRRTIELGMAVGMAFSAPGVRQRILPKFAAKASTLRRWTCSTEQSALRIM